MNQDNRSYQLSHVWNKLPTSEKGNYPKINPDKDPALRLERCVYVSN